MLKKNMNINKILWVTSVCVFAFGLAYFINGFIYYKTYVPKTVAPEKKIGRNHNKTVTDTKIIYKKNIFDLDYEQESKISKVKENNNLSYKIFNGKLLGILTGNGKNYAVIKYNKELLVLEEGVEKKGLLLTKVFNNSVELEYKNKKYLLKYEKSKVQSNYKYKKNTPLSDTSSKITVENNTITIPRSILVAELKDINKVLRSVLVSPSYKNGKFVGYRVSRLKKDSIFRKIGIINGDIIVKINGEPLTTPEKLFEFFSKTEDITAVTVDLIRFGKKKSLFIEID